jgi:signal transduction histidine kinase
LLKNSWLVELRTVLSSATKVSDLCTQALSHIKKIFGVTGCSIFVASPSTDELRLVATTKPGTKTARVPPYRLGEGLTGWIAQNRKVLRLRNIDDQRELSSYPGLTRGKGKWSEVEVKGQKRFLGAPLLAQGALVGVIRLATKHNDDDFNASDESMIQAVAGRLALAIQNLWLKEQGDALVDLSQRLANAPDRRQVGEAILDLAINTLGVQFGHIRFLNQSEQALELLALRRDPGARPPRFRRLGEGISGVVGQERKPYIAQNLSEEFRFRHLLKRENELQARRFVSSVKSLACFPLMVHKDLVGTLILESRRSYAFGADQVRFLWELSSKVAAAVQPALTLSRLREIGIRFSQTLDLNTLLPLVLETASAETKFESGTLRILSRDGKRWELRHATGVDPNILIDPLPFRADVLKRAADDHRAVRVFDAKRDREFQTFIRNLPSRKHKDYLREIRSYLIVPITWNKSYIGFIFLGSKSYYEVPERTVEFLRVLATEAAVAIRNAQLYSERDQALRSVETLAALGILRGGISHRIRHGLHKMLVNLPSSKSRTSREILNRQIDAARQDVQDVLEYVRDLEGVAADSSRGRVDLNGSVREALNHSLVRFSRGTKHRLRLASGDVLIDGNRTLIELAFELVIANAAEAMPTGGNLTVTSAVAGAEIRVSFSDSGKGMSSETLGRIQNGDLFFTTKEGGTGLGLAIVFDVARRYGGRVEVKSASGKGTRLTIVLPRSRG